MKNLKNRPASISMARYDSEINITSSMSTSTQNEIDICKYFFTNYCTPLKTKRTNFGKVTIETMLNTYVSGEAFYLALKALDIPLSGTNYHNCTFALKLIKKQPENSLFGNFALAKDRFEEIKIQKEINLCSEWIRTVPKRTTKINKNRSSYGWKHDVERWAGVYISNDSFKTAAKIAGLMTVPSGCSNECYNIILINNKNQ
jgi:hypothetical protein